VIVADNGSADGSVEMIRGEFPEVLLVENNANLGFGAANNRASEISSGKYLLFLNSDTILLNDAVKEFFDEAEKNPDTILGCRLTDESGNDVNSFADYTCIKKGIYRCVIQLYPKINDFKKKFVKKNSSVKKNDENIGFIIGADLFISRKIFFDAGKFDENFFMYFEDEDLCRRAKKNSGCRLKIIDSPEIIHLESRSTKVKILKVIFFEQSFIHYVKKHESIAKKISVYFFFIFYSFLRMFDFSISFADRTKLFKNIFKSIFSGRRFL
jgi:GT2 family glycosyltransferase